MNCPIHTITVRRDALNDVRDLLRDELEWRPEPQASKVVLVLDEVNGQIKGLEFALDALRARAAAELARDAAGYRRSSKTLFTMFREMGSDYLINEALSAFNVSSLDAIRDEDMGALLSRLTSFIKDPPPRPARPAEAGSLETEAPFPSPFLSVQAIVHPRPDVEPDYHAAPKTKPLVREMAEVCASFPGFSPEASIAPAAEREAASPPEDRTQKALDSGITSPAGMKAAAGALAADAAKPIGSLVKEKPLSQKERVLEAYQAGHTTADAIAQATGIGKGSVGAVMSMLRKEGAIPSDEKAKVLAAYEAGKTTPEEIAAHTGLGLPTARQYLHVLRREGKVAHEPEAAPVELETVAEATDQPAKQPERFIGPKARVSQAWYDGLRGSKEIAEKTGIREETVIYTLGVLRSEGKIKAEPVGRTAQAGEGKPLAM